MDFALQSSDRGYAPRPPRVASTPLQPLVAFAAWTTSMDTSRKVLSYQHRMLAKDLIFIIKRFQKCIPRNLK